MAKKGEASSSSVPFLCPAMLSSDGFVARSGRTQEPGGRSEPFHPGCVAQMTRMRQGSGEEWPSVFVPGPNEASAAMNSSFHGCTAVSW